MNTPLSFIRATVVGLSGKQAAVLRQQLGDTVDLRIVSPERALKMRGNQSDVVITTRFIGHKHEWHLRRICNCRVVCIQHGGAQAVARTLEAITADLRKAA